MEDLYILTARLMQTTTDRIKFYDIIETIELIEATGTIGIYKRTDLKNPKKSVILKSPAG